MLRLLLILSSLFATAAFAATPASASLAWTAPAANVDGTAITGAITYNIYQGLTGALVKVQSGVTGVTATITTGLTAGTSQCFAVTAVVAGVESAQSTQACAAIPAKTPSAPSSLTVVESGG
jgi:hypothetical protein